MTAEQDQFFTKIYKERRKPLLMYAENALGNHAMAEDAVQQAFEIGWRKIEDFQNCPQPEGWIFKSLKFEVTSDELYKIDFDSKYFSKLLSTTQESFKTEFKELLKLLQKYPGKTLTEIMETLPENQKTRELLYDGLVRKGASFRKEGI